MNSRVNTSYSKYPLSRMNIIEIYTALLNYILAKQTNGFFSIHIQDYGLADNADTKIFNTIKTLEWLGISSDCKPTLQSNNIDIYKEKLELLISGNNAYRCFCNQKNNAVAQKTLYNRACLNLSSEVVKAKLAAGQKFVWRLKTETPIIPQQLSPTSKKLTFTPLTFKDFPITTPNGDFTKVFTNFIDNWLSKITHKFINHYELEEIQQQGLLCDIFLLKQPNFYLLPEIVNPHGELISESDFGFFIDDLRQANINSADILLMLTKGQISEKIDIFNQKCPISNFIPKLVKVFNFKQLSANNKIIFDIQKIYH